MKVSGDISAIERRHLMTMFSMKPKFDLAEFLAVPATKGAARSSVARRRGTQFKSDAPSEDAIKPTLAKDTSSADRP